MLCFCFTAHCAHVVFAIADIQHKSRQLPVTTDSPGTPCTHVHVHEEQQQQQQQYVSSPLAIATHVHVHEEQQQQQQQYVSSPLAIAIHVHVHEEQQQQYDYVSSPLAIATHVHVHEEQQQQYVTPTVIQQQIISASLFTPNSSVVSFISLPNTTPSDVPVEDASSAVRAPVTPDIIDRGPYVMSVVRKLKF